jgi:hypothetical protein
MNCEQFEQIVHELDRPRASGGSGGPETGAGNESEAALAHAESCSRCGKLLTEVEGLNFALRAIASHEAEEKAPARLEAGLLREFREHAASQRRQQARREWKTAARLKAFVWYGAVAGGAVAALFALGLIRGWIGMAPRQPHRTAAARTAAAQNEGMAKNRLQMGRAVVSPRATQQNAPAGNSAASDDATDFYALPYADDLASLDGGAVIRVSVPRSALVAWGLPVSGIGGAEPIPADLVVSADGTPQAIRLVAQSDQ